MPVRARSTVHALTTETGPQRPETRERVVGVGWAVAVFLFVGGIWGVRCSEFEDRKATHTSSGSLWALCPPGETLALL